MIGSGEYEVSRSHPLQQIVQNAANSRRRITKYVLTNLTVERSQVALIIVTLIRYRVDQNIHRLGRLIRESEHGPGFGRICISDEPELFFNFVRCKANIL